MRRWEIVMCRLLQLAIATAVGSVDDGQRQGTNGPSGADAREDEVARSVHVASGGAASGEALRSRWCWR